MNDTFMKERPVFPLILSMAMPMVISMLVNSPYNIVDSFFVAQISEDAMTALSLVFPVQNFSNFEIVSIRHVSLCIKDNCISFNKKQCRISISNCKKLVG